jgi:aryl-alcohol dehydrogenase-like predicted oxidoreductase
MEYRVLGKRGLEMSVLGLAAAPFGLLLGFVAAILGYTRIGQIA